MAVTPKARHTGRFFIFIFLLFLFYFISCQKPYVYDFLLVRLQSPVAQWLVAAAPVNTSRSQVRTSVKTFISVGSVNTGRSQVRASVNSFNSIYNIYNIRHSR